MVYRYLIIGLMVLLGLGAMFTAIITSNDAIDITGKVTEDISISFTATLPAAETQPTPAGSDVAVDFPTQDVTVTFKCVITPGTTGVTKSTTSTRPDMVNFRTVHLFWEIWTTVGYTCPAPDTTLITICARGFDVHPGYKIFHWENVPPERWVDRTSFVDAVADIICAEVPYLSLFGIFEAIPAGPPAHEGGGGGTGWDPRYASAMTVHQAQEEAEYISEEGPEVVRKVIQPRAPEEKPELLPEGLVPVEILPVVEAPPKEDYSRLYMQIGLIGLMILIIIMLFIMYKKKR